MLAVVFWNDYIDQSEEKLDFFPATLGLYLLTISTLSFILQLFIMFSFLTKAIKIEISYPKFCKSKFQIVYGSNFF